MSVQSEIDRIKANLSGAYSAVSEKGGTLPETQNSANLPEAIRTISGEELATYIVKAVIGSIIWWPDPDNIPTGWHICDGTDGTIDLRDKFILAAGTKHTVGQTGGSEEVTLTEQQIPQHSHSFYKDTSGGSWTAKVNEGTQGNLTIVTRYASNGKGTTFAVGGSASHTNMPPYYTLCAIQKIGPDETDGDGIPAGVIVIWSGSEENIPSGWALCDGENGRPNLRDRFILGSGAKHTVGETGGSEEVTLTVAQMPEHNHTTDIAHTGINISLGSNRFYGRSGQEVASVVTSDSGNSEPHPNMPPYYTLCYIIKL